MNLSQYEGKHFRNVKRKGKSVSRKVFLSKDAREALGEYIEKHRGREKGPLFCSFSGERLARQAVDGVLKVVSAQANATLPPEQHIHVSAHILRHTFLREVAGRYGVQYAKELAGHTSDRYIWRYVQPSDEDKQEAVDGLF